MLLEPDGFELAGMDAFQIGHSKKKDDHKLAGMDSLRIGLSRNRMLPPQGLHHAAFGQAMLAMNKYSMTMQRSQMASRIDS